MRKPIKIALGLVLGLGLTVLVLEFTYPRDFEKHVERVLPASPTRIYHEIAAPKTWLTWSFWNREADPTCEHSFRGPERGKGAIWDWKDGAELGTGKFEILAASPEKGIEYRISMEGMKPFAGTIALSPEGEGTKIVWTSRGNVGDDLGLGVMMAIADMTGMMEGMYTTSLDGLAKRIAEKPKLDAAVEATYQKSGK